MVKNGYCAGKNDNKERIFDLDAEQDQHEAGNEQQVMHQEQEGAFLFTQQKSLDLRPGIFVN